MILGQIEDLKTLIGIWRGDAERIRRYDPKDKAATTLEACVEDLQRVLGATAPDWVPISALQVWTRWSRQTLVKRCRELEARGEARKGRNGWEVTLEAALAWPQKTAAHVDVNQVSDLQELARLLGRREGP